MAKTHGEQLEEALLLTMSNLLFIPAIILATYRRFYVEALVYFYTMFMSTVRIIYTGSRLQRVKRCKILLVMSGARCNRTFLTLQSLNLLQRNVLVTTRYLF